ncbi:hypothetical protein [Bacillus badius]|uniref:Uncharacterized protein n=1 Tax=Bacillus badius TaxID=1455 RepID=A0ABR5AV18_BACBA|nr:hypothetical protein [Bacillus badius]KIL78048.1 hypothetical protein SD77_1027 [Bacillus badius]MED4718613.1 hypothetical protein [Bacillus badius]
MIVFHAHDKFFLPNMQEVALATLVEWQEQGTRIEIHEEELID